MTSTPTVSRDMRIEDVATIAPPPKRARLTEDTVRQFKDAKELLKLGVLGQCESDDLKAKLVSGV